MRGQISRDLTRELTRSHAGISQDLTQGSHNAVATAAQETSCTAMTARCRERVENLLRMEKCRACAEVRSVGRSAYTGVAAVSCFPPEIRCARREWDSAAAQAAGIRGEDLWCMLSSQRVKTPLQVLPGFSLVKGRRLKRSVVPPLSDGADQKLSAGSTTMMWRSWWMLLGSSFGRSGTSSRSVI